MKLTREDAIAAMLPQQRAGLNGDYANASDEAISEDLNQATYELNDAAEWIENLRAELELRRIMRGAS